MLSRWAILTALLTAGLFLAAGTTQVTSLRVYIAVFSTMLVVTMLAVRPERAQERTHPGGEGKDQGVRSPADSCFWSPWAGGDGRGSAPSIGRELEAIKSA